jgi:protein-tyrosine phosphatase
MSGLPRKPSVLFVCTGNICRSPSAEGILRKRLQEQGLEVVVDSAGTHGYHVGDAPDQRSIRAAAKRGYDISKLKARRISSEDFERFDFVIALDDDHMRLMRQVCPPEQQHKLREMMAFAPTAAHREVPDPYYGPAEGFELVLDLLEEAIEGLLKELKPGQP